MEAVPNTQYTLSYRATMNSNNQTISSVMYYDIEGTLINYIRTNGTGDKTINFTTPNNIKYLVITFGCDANPAQECNFSNIRLIKTSELAPFITSNTEVTETNDHTLTAKWSQNYTLTFNANDGNVETASKIVNYGYQYGELPTPTRSGYIFDGWKNLDDQKNILKLNVGSSNPSNETFANTTKRTFQYDTYVQGLAYDNYYAKNNVSSLEVNANYLRLTSSSGYGVGFPLNANANTQ